MPEKVKSQSLSIYLGKERVAAVVDLVDAHGCDTYPIQSGVFRGTLFARPSERKQPGWVGFLQPGSAKNIDVASMAASALLVAKVGGRWFALAFGHGRHLLRAGAYEEGFGLRVCLNCIDPKGIRSIDRSTFEDGVRQGREQTGRDSGIEEFGLNIERDMLRAVTGKPHKEAELGSSISGMDALAIHVEVTLGTLPELLTRLLKHFASAAYRQGYPWVDHIKEVRDKTRVEDLDARLVEHLRRADPNVWMAVPEIVEWHAIGGFAYSLVKGAAKRPDLHVSGLREHLLSNGGVTLESLLRTKVYRFNRNDHLSGQAWSAYGCLYAEVEASGMHVLSTGRWYKIDAGYADDVKGIDKKLPATGVKLPDALQDEDEEAYNKRAAKAIAGAVLLDRRTVRLDRHIDTIEICDILHEPSNTFVHVKKWGQSAVLSHLFAQGFVSADLFLHEPKFRDEARKRIGQWVPVRRPNAKDYEVAFAIISNSDKALNLPFFSKVNLRSCVERLQGRGYRVTLTKIQEG